MNFDDAYRQLEDEFKKRVVEDRKQWKVESVYLPNVAPKAPVDYVLIGMEPSLKGWAKDIPDAQEKICKGFRNFYSVWQLHFAISEYLCRTGETCYITDLSKGAMATNSPGAGNKEKYQAWYPLLERELGLVAKPDARIISIGTTVGRFLSDMGLYGHAGTIPHYGGAGVKHFGKEVPSKKAEYESFAAGLKSICYHSRKRTGHSCATEHVLRTITPSDSWRKLMFDYKVRFERIRNQDTQGWRQQQKNWQSLLS